MGFVLLILAVVLLFSRKDRKGLMRVIFKIIKLFVKAALYCSPITFTLSMMEQSNWWLIVCIPLSVGYYFLINKIFKKMKTRKLVVS